jgi:cell division protein FtsW
MAIVEPYRMARLTSFLHPTDSAEGAGFQAAQAKIALGSGGPFGVGIGNGVQKAFYLPEAHTDMISAVIGEELGLVGTLVVLGMSLTLAYVGIRVALRTEDTFTRLATAGIVGWITAQALVNMGAVLGLLPITGIPLPLVSYGGSAMLPTLFALGLLVSFARREPAARAALAERSANRAASRAAARTRRKSSARHDEG